MRECSAALLLSALLSNGQKLIARFPGRKFRRVRNVEPEYQTELR